VRAAAHPPAWDWSFSEDGNLALDRHELWDEFPQPPRVAVSQARATQVSLHAQEASDTVQRMPPPRAPGHELRVRRRRGARRARRFAGLALVSAVAIFTLVLTAFGSSAERVAGSTFPEYLNLAPAGPPEAQIVAARGELRLQLPIAQTRVTAIGYHAADDGSLALEPVGRRGNQGLLGRLAERIFGAPDDRLVWYQLPGGGGPATAVLNVGAAPGTDVYSPVDGTVIGITDVIVDGSKIGVRIDIQPAAAPTTVVSVSRLRPDASLAVGATVAAGTRKLGTVLDFSNVEQQALARYTQDAGNHVAVAVRPAASSL
jgi:hypothetical protein